MRPLHVSLLVLLSIICWSLPALSFTQEQQRLREHLSTVEQDLRARDVSHLSEELQLQRAKNLDRLHEYWQAGVFPHNTRHPGERVPYFVDDHGHACAVGALLLADGEEAIVDDIVERQNYAVVPEIDSPELGRWLAHSGLTVQEATRIQPSYEFEVRDRCISKCDCTINPVCVDWDRSDLKTVRNPCVADCYVEVDGAEILPGVCDNDNPIEGPMSCEEVTPDQVADGQPRIRPEDFGSCTMGSPGRPQPASLLALLVVLGLWWKRRV